MNLTRDEFGKAFQRMIDLKGRRVSEEMFQAWYLEFRDTDHLDWACACDQITMSQNTWPTLGQMHGAVSRARGDPPGDASETLRYRLA